MWKVQVFIILFAVNLSYIEPTSSLYEYQQQPTGFTNPHNIFRRQIIFRDEDDGPNLVPNYQQNHFQRPTSQNVFQQSVNTNQRPQNSFPSQTQRPISPSTLLNQRIPSSNQVNRLGGRISQKSN